MLFFQNHWQIFTVHNIPNNDVDSGFTIVPYSISHLEECNDDNSVSDEDSSKAHPEKTIYVLVFEQKRMIEFETLIKYITSKSTSSDKINRYRKCS